MAQTDRKQRGRRVAAVAALGLVCALLAAASSAGTEQACPRHEWDGVSRVVALGDVHGMHGEVTFLLAALELIDETGAWSGGEDHLVFVGDLLDRGAEGRQLLDLARRLQVEAEAAGGRVHVLLGNHESMNLVRDFRYVSSAGFAAFADLEREEDRRLAWEGYRSAECNSGYSEKALRNSFDKSRPPGWFGRARALGPGGVYGDWLLEQPTIIRINGLLFVHAGLTEEVASLGIAEINRIVRKELSDFAAQRAVLVEEGAVAPFATFTEVVQAAGAYGPPNGTARTLAGYRAATGLLAYLKSIVADPDGPLWYRGGSLEDERIERTRLAESLRLLGARSMIVGHSMTRSGLVHSRFDQTLFRTDVGLVGGGRPQALVFQDGDVRVYDAAAGKYGPVVVEPPPGERRFQAWRELPDARAEQFLRTAAVRDERPLGRGRTRPLLLTLQQGEKELRALFKTVDATRRKGKALPSPDRYQHEVAAYKLDRMLGFGLVPATVLRKLNGRGQGSLQLWVESAVDEESTRFYSLPEVHEAEVATQRAHSVIFDALIGNAGRKETDVLHLPLEGRILLVDHSEAFSTQREIEPFLTRGACVLDRKTERALRSLSRESLREGIGAFLNKEQIRAVLARRDLLLQRCRREPREIW